VQHLSFIAAGMEKIAQAIVDSINPTVQIGARNAHDLGQLVSADIVGF
jgi:ketopantoate hydroxymethyltransferase